MTFDLNAVGFLFARWTMHAMEPFPNFSNFLDIPYALPLVLSDVFTDLYTVPIIGPIIIRFDYKRQFCGTAFFLALAHTVLYL